MEHISRTIAWSLIQFVFIVCQVEGYSETKLHITNFYLINMELVFLRHFLYLKKNISLIIFY